MSFPGSNLLPTLILVGEALVLLALGIVTRVRIFILSSAALVVGALRALFLSTPPSLALILLGGILLAIATALLVARRQLKLLGRAIRASRLFSVRSASDLTVWMLT